MKKQNVKQISAPKKLNIAKSAETDIETNDTRQHKHSIAS